MKVKTPVRGASAGARVAICRWKASILVFCLWLPLLDARATEPATAAAETARLNSWLNASYEEELRQSPMQLTTLGRKTSYAEIDDFSEAGELAKYRLLEQSVAELRRTFDYEKLTPEGRISYDYWIYRLQVFKEGLPFLRHHYQFTTEWGAHSYLPEFLINLHSVDTEQEMLDYISRVRASARALRQSLQRAQVAAEEGIRPPRFAHESVIDVSGKVITGAPFNADADTDAPLWADANSKIASLLTRGLIDTTTAQTLREQTRAALNESLLPAYRELIAWLQTDLPNTTVTPQGVASLPNGHAFYDYCLAYYTTTDMSATEIHTLGLGEVARIRGEVQQIMKSLEFEGTVKAFFQYIRTDQQFYFSNDDIGREAYIEQSMQFIDTMNARLPEYFGIIPNADMVVKRVEPFMEQDGMSPFYQDGSADGARPGTYYLHLSDMSALNRTDVETTAYHEAVPGHHMQSAIALEQRELPLFRRDIWYSAYGEGWALYAEYLAREMGAFSDPYNEVGSLNGELFRSVRLVVDTGLHAQGWSEQDAVEYMLANTALPEVLVRAEIRRYLSDPGQATSYKVGMLKLLALREQANSALGGNFDIRGFHDAVLGGGSLPLPILEKRINNWISNQQATSPPGLPRSVD